VYVSAHLAAHDGLDTVSDDISGLQGVTHAIGAHGNAVRDTNGVEAEASEASLRHTWGIAGEEEEEEEGGGKAGDKMKSGIMQKNTIHRLMN
jgi:hypothetical protein